MNQPPTDIAREEDYLGSLAMRFRGTRGETERRAVADEYARTVDRLVQSGQWTEAPPFEDQLPDEWMPKAFADYWFGDGPA